MHLTKNCLKHLENNVKPGLLHKNNVVRKTVNLINLPFNEYVNIEATRVTHLKIKEIKDKFTSKIVLTGNLEDKTFKTPFLSYNTSSLFELSSVLQLQNVSSHISGSSINLQR